MTSSVHDDGIGSRGVASRATLVDDAKTTARAGFEAGLSLAVDAFPNATLVLDRAGRVVASNQGARDLVDHFAEPGLQRKMDAVMATAQHTCSPACVELALGEKVVRRFHVTSLIGRNGVDVTLFLVTEDADKPTPLGLPQEPSLLTYELAPNPMRALREEAARFKRLSETDPLTGTLNIRAFASHVRQALTDKPRQTGAMICLDLNRFKTINDRYGHVAGDKVLMHVASKLSFPAQTGILTARMGGDEFALWMPGVAMRGLEDVMTNLRMRMSVPLDLSEQRGQPLAVTVKASMGAACCPDEALNYTTLRRVADRRLYEDKARCDMRKSRKQAPKRKGAVDPAPQSFLPR
ncbi:MAG: GGDEF domain-containing protein [Pseudomonadota bacterium]